MRKFQILSQCKTMGVNSLASPHHADKIHLKKDLTLEAGGWILGTEGRV
jgi:hypothetical protein